MTELVKRDRKLAETCLEVVREKRAQSGTKDEAFRYLEESLDDAMLLATPAPTCAPDVLHQLERLVDKSFSADDKEFVINTLIRLCPEQGKTYYHKLGDMLPG